jgi:hypothetical protein
MPERQGIRAILETRHEMEEEFVWLKPEQVRSKYPCS